MDNEIYFLLNMKNKIYTVLYKQPTVIRAKLKTIKPSLQIILNYYTDFLLRNTEIMECFIFYKLYS